MFYNGLGATNQFMINATACGALMTKTPGATYALLAKLASSSY